MGDEYFQCAPPAVFLLSLLRRRAFWCLHADSYLNFAFLFFCCTFFHMVYFVAMRMFVMEDEDRHYRRTRESWVVIQGYMMVLLCR